MRKRPLIQSPLVLALFGGLIGLALAPTTLAQKFGGKDLGSPFGLKTPGADLGEPLTVEAKVIRAALAPNDQGVIAVVLKFGPHYHAWPSAEQDVLPQEVADFAIRTEISLINPPSWIKQVGGIQWPEPTPALVPDLNNIGQSIEVPVYQGRAIAYIPFLIADSIEPGEQKLTVSVYIQVCDESKCLPPESIEASATFQLASSIETAAQLNVGTPTDQDFAGFDLSKVSQGLAAGPGADAIAFNAFGIRFSIDPTGPIGMGLLLLTAALGGFLLNFTPCVLPVIPLKIMGLSASAGNPRRTLLLGAIMSMGVVAFWLGMGAAIALISGFDAISSLFQQSWFSLAVGGLIGVMGVGMLGLFTIRLPQAVYKVNPSHDSLHGSFLFGIMTAVLSTPCTAPFMGTAAAWATTQTTLTTMVTFATIGLGMALPYIVLSANPKWVSKMPRTGPASEVVKQVMGLLMLAVAAFFLGIGIVSITNEPPSPPNRLYWWVVTAFAVVAGGLLAVRTFQLTKSPMRRIGFSLVSLLLAGGALGATLIVTEKGPIDWVYYTPERFAQARADGKIVVMDFTAEWCLNCKAIEKAILFRDDVSGRIARDDIVPFKVDLTGGNDAGQAMLREAGSVAIPFLAIFPPVTGDPVFSSDSYTAGQVLSGIDLASGAGQASTPVAQSK